MNTEILIVGAGVAGAFAARELARYDVSVCVVEQGYDVAVSTSGANSGIVHAGYDTVPGSVESGYDAAGNRLFPQLAAELGFAYRNTGSLVLAFTESDTAKIGELCRRGQAKGIPGLEIISGERARELEPALSERVVQALHAPSAGVVSPYEVTHAAMENAVENGVLLRRDCRVEAIARETHAGTAFSVSTTAGTIRCRFLVNAAGLYADDISRMAGDASFSIHPRKGEYLLLDKVRGDLVGRVIFQPPTRMGKGILISPTVEGNLLLGPNARDITDRDDDATTEQGLAEVLRGARKSVPGLDAGAVITTFAGQRAIASTQDFIIGESPAVPGLIQLAGLKSPGLTAAPAIGAHLPFLLRQAGMHLEARRDFDPFRRRPKRLSEMTPGEMDRAVCADPDYGRIVCRCETVSEAEVTAAIRAPVGSDTLDGVKRRTRAGTGRCQGGFCTPRLLAVLSRELGVPMEEITKCGPGSRILKGRTRA